MASASRVTSMPGHARRALAGQEEAAEHPDGRGLAGAVGAQEPEDLPGPHAEVEAGDRSHRPEAAGEIRAFRWREACRSAPLRPGRTRSCLIRDPTDGQPYTGRSLRKGVNPLRLPLDPRAGKRLTRPGKLTSVPCVLMRAVTRAERKGKRMSVKKLLLAKPRGFCAGVDRAIDVVNLALDLYPGPVYVRKEIVHNVHVVNELRTKGAIFVDELDEVPDGATVIFSAHGVSPEVRARATARGLKVIDATCPLVTKVHHEAVRFAQEGRPIVLVGHEGHDEVVGTMGHAPEHIQLIGSVEEAEALQVSDPDRVAVITQTTLSLDDTSAVMDALRRRFPSITAPARDDICYATQNRQVAVKAMARRAPGDPGHRVARTAPTAIGWPRWRETRAPGPT